MHTPSEEHCRGFSTSPASAYSSFSYFLSCPHYTHARWDDVSAGIIKIEVEFYAYVNNHSDTKNSWIQIWIKYSTYT